MEKEEQEEKEGLQNLLEEAEILAELKEEERVRKKNAKIVSMAVVGFIICGAVFFWTRYSPPQKPPIGNEPPPPKKEELFPEPGKIKSPGQPVREMKSLEAPLESEDDTLPAKQPRTGRASLLPSPKQPSPKKSPEKKKEIRKDLEAYRIRVGICVLPEELRKAEKQVRSLGLSPSSVKGKNKVGMHKVLVGPYPTREKATVIRNRLQAGHVKGNVTMFEGSYFIRVGAFYKKDGALKMRDRMKKMGYSSRPLFQPTEILCHTLFATGHGDHATAQAKVNLLKKKGFKAAAIVRKD